MKLGTVILYLEILHQCGKRVKTKSQKVFWGNSKVCRSYRGKTGGGGGTFCPPPSWIGLNQCSISLPPENVKKPLAFWLCQGVQNWKISLKSFKHLDMFLYGKVDIFSKKVENLRYQTRMRSLKLQHEKCYLCYITKGLIDFPFQVNRLVHNGKYATASGDIKT